MNDHVCYQNCVQPGVEDHVFDLLAMTVIRHEDAFLKHLNCDPRDRWHSDNLHPFSAKLEEAYHLAGVLPRERVAWKREVKAQFIALNFTGLPINEIEHNYQQIKVGARNLLQITNNLDMSQQHSSHLIFQMDNHIQTLSAKVETVEGQLSEMTGVFGELVKEVKSLKSLLSSGAQGAVADSESHTVPRSPPPRTPVTRCYVGSWSSVKS